MENKKKRDKKEKRDPPPNNRSRYYHQLVSRGRKKRYDLSKRRGRAAPHPTQAPSDSQSEKIRQIFLKNGSK